MGEEGDTYSCDEQPGHSLIDKILMMQREPTRTEDFLVLRDFLRHLEKGSLANFKSECEGTLTVDRSGGRA